MAKYDKQRELHLRIEYLQHDNKQLRALLVQLMKPALGLTDDEIRLLRAVPPVELLDGIDQAELDHRMKQWVNDVLEQRERDRNRQIIENGCPNCGERYDGVYE